METTHTPAVKMDEKIIKFIKEQTVATVCCIDSENNPYCFSCFYAYDGEKNLLYFKTSASTHHAQLMQKNKLVAGTIQPDKLNRLAIQGIQFSGEVLIEDNSLCADASSVYHKKYPFALAMAGEVWTIQPDTIKMTDNTLAFGKKIIWQLN